MRACGLVGILLACAQASAAAGFGASFSADMVQSGPQQPPVLGKMYVDDGRIRTEIGTNEQQSVQIIDPNAGRFWMLMPQQKVYAEMPVPPTASTPVGSSGGNGPCARIPGASCRRAGEETLNGRSAVKWEVTANRQDGRTQQGAIWTDAKHGFPVKQLVGGEVVAELRYLGAETVNGRATEKWSAATNAAGQGVLTTQWYDPQLNIAIRQELPGGFTRELRNIRIGKQADVLFRIPADYRKVDGPVPGTAAAH
jgi:hypothetical protein